MYTGGTTPFHIGFLCIFIILCACSNTPIEDYLPKNQEEKDIVALLVQYQEARKHFHLEQYLGCLHEQGIYHHASRVMLSKKALAARLPGFWAELQKGNRLFFPMCRENLSGNYFVGFRLVNPTIYIDRNTATVTAIYVNTGWRIRHYISLIKENNRWWINRLDWETG